MLDTRNLFSLGRTEWIGLRKLLSIVRWTVSMENQPCSSGNISSGTPLFDTSPVTSESRSMPMRSALKFEVLRSRHDSRDLNDLQLVGFQSVQERDPRSSSERYQNLDLPLLKSSTVVIIGDTFRVPLKSFL